VANPNNREGIEAIGSSNAASANAANNVQIPQRQVTVQAPSAPHRPVEVEHVHGPQHLRRGDWLQLTPMASQKVVENSAVGPPRAMRRSELQEQARESPHGEDLAAIAKGEKSAEEFQEKRRREKDSK
jgi:hypothetical protein